MPLTTCVSRRNNPVRQFLEQRFPHTRPLVREARERLAGATTLRPAEPVLWTVVGIAFDYRAQYYFANSPEHDWARVGAKFFSTLPPSFFFYDRSPEHDWARVGAKFFSSTALYEDPLAPHLESLEIFPPGAPELDEEGLAQEFFQELAAVEAAIRPAGRRLPPAQEVQLNRYCYVLALFEALGRSGLVARAHALYTLPRLDLDALLALAPPPALDDLCQLSWAFYEHCADLFARPAVLRPTFDGSHDVGGADADLIVAGCLIDLKTTVNPRVDKLWLYQLLGYVLLDYSDTYQIDAVALYLARQRTMLRWPLDQFLDRLAGGALPALSALRAEFRACLSPAGPPPEAPSSASNAG